MTDDLIADLERDGRAMFMRAATHLRETSELIMQYETDLANKDRRIAELEGFEGIVNGIAAVPHQVEDLSYVATNVCYSRGSLPKDVKRDATEAIRTYRAIVEDARSALNSQQVSK